MTAQGAPRRLAPPWLLWLEIAAVLALLAGLGISRFARLTRADREELQLEAGLEQLYNMEMEHFQRLGVYFPPDHPAYGPYLTWMERYVLEVRCQPQDGFSVVVHADMDGDGEPGSWRIDQGSPQVQRIARD